MLAPEELRARRLALGFTQTRLAEALGVAPNTIARWERGERTMRNVGLVLEAFDRLALAQRAQHNLPATLTSFVGREDGVRELAVLVRSQRIVTLTGAGGCGKSRLALEVAANVNGSFTDGSWLVEMAALNDGALLASSVAAALDIADPANRPPLDALARALRGKHLLLILDNCEHLLRAASEVIDRVARSCPHVHLLATSREPLRIDGEVRYRVPALAPADAVRLFVERARAVKHTFALDAVSEPVVARVCQRLDGMPLAIELAAARASVLSPIEIEARLDHRLAFLTGGSRVAQPRQRTLRATLDWSYALLGEDHRALLRRVSVFSGSWSRAAMDVVCGATGVDSLDALEHLVNAALVSTEESAPETRYRLLESVREYAAEQLRAANEDTLLRDRHLAWYAALAEQAEPELRGPEQSVWFDRLELELDNLRAALDWARTASDVDAAVRLGASLWEFWELRGRAHEGLTLMHPLLDRSVDVTPRTRAKLLWATGSVALACGENDLAESLLEQSLQLARVLDNPWHAGRALVRLGNLAFYRGDVDRAAALFEENLAIRRALDHQRGIAVSVHNLAEVALRRGDTETATRLFQDSLRMGREQHDTQLIAGTLVRLGDIARLEHDLAHAATLIGESVRLNREIAATAQFPDCLEALARVAFDAVDPERATRLLAASDSVREEWGVPIPPIDWPAHQRLRAELHRALGNTVFDSTWAAGRAEPIESALQHAVATHAPRARHGPLSPREGDVARQIARGLTNRQIAERLIVSERTVDAHCRSIYDKLGVGSRAQVAAWAVATGLAAAE